LSARLVGVFDDGVVAIALTDDAPRCRQYGTTLDHHDVWCPLYGVGYHLGPTD